MSAMRVAVVDVGSNTVRLLVGERDGAGIRRVDEERVRLALGADVERTGALSGKRLARATDAVAREVAKARKLGASEITVLLTSPGRQARNGVELRKAIAARTGADVRLLSAAEEGRLGYSGAVAAAGVPGGSIAVCDAGGGSTQLAVGTGRTPSWVRSVDIGSLRLTRRLLTDDPPSRGELSAARTEAASAFEGLVPPLPRRALATGGTARALGRIVGRRLDSETLAVALSIASSSPAKRIASRYEIQQWRARVLPAGALILAQVQQLLNVPLEVARGGLREGAALELLEHVELATALPA
jgi:exopolyphosphatase / guanosine-5'-triphosphate,3'-diphosphate pyrophosphatase